MEQERQHKSCSRKYIEEDINNVEGRSLRLQYKYMTWISNVILLLFVGIASYTVKNINDQLIIMSNQAIQRDNRITTIETSRFTDKDGLQLWQEIWKIRDEISKSTIAPQKELSDKLNGINKDIATLNMKINELSILLKEHRDREVTK
jgi:TolA-binding protein